MPQVRHIKISWLVRFPPPPPPPHNDVFVLQNLQTLTTVEGLILTDEVCKRIPNIKKLVIHYDANAKGEEASSSSYYLQNVECFSKLESLQCSGYTYKHEGDFVRSLKLPSSLKKLSLLRCKLVWSDMAMIASLPHLQILKLLDYAVVGAEWNCFEQEFMSLKHLEISRGDLICWSADTSNFPVLETIHLDYLTQLEEIPSGIGVVPTLEKIQMFECNKSANFSAVKILEEQESLGNMGLQVGIMFKHKSEAKKLQEEIEEELDITCQNLRIHSDYD